MSEHRPSSESLTHWISFTLGLGGVLLCALILAGEAGGAGCWGSGAGRFFDCSYAARTNPLEGTGVSLAQVGLIFWMAACLLLLGQGSARAGRLCALVLRGALPVAALIAWGLLAYQFLAVAKATGSGGLCPLCLADAVLVSVVAALVWRSPGCRVEGVPWPGYLGSLTAAFFGGLLLFGPAGWVRGGAEDIPAEEFRRMLLREVDPSLLEKFGLCGFGDPAHERKISLEGLISADDHIEGSAEAPVQMTVFFDPFCPGCIELGAQLGQLEALLTKTGRTGQVAVRHVPQVLREDSRHAAQVLWLLRGRKEFGAVKTMIGRMNPGERGDEALAVLLRRQLGDAEGSAIMERVLAGEGVEALEDSSRRAMRAGITGLPAVFINSRLLPGTPRNRQADCLLQTLVGSGEVTPDKPPAWDDCCGL